MQYEFGYIHQVQQLCVQSTQDPLTKIVNKESLAVIARNTEASLNPDICEFCRHSLPKKLQGAATIEVANPVGSSTECVI